MMIIREREDERVSVVPQMVFQLALFKPGKIYFGSSSTTLWNRYSSLDLLSLIMGPFQMIPFTYNGRVWVFFSCSAVEQILFN